MSTEKIRKEVHTRCEFAQKEYDRLTDIPKFSSKISGLNAYKINQAYRIWIHYRDEFLNTLDGINGELPRHRPNLKR